MTMYWRYRAYDLHYRFVDGIGMADSFSQLAINLRQQGLQITEATSICQNDYLAEKRLANMRSKFDSLPVPTSPPKPTKIRRLFLWLNRIVLRR